MKFIYFLLLALFFSTSCMKESSSLKGDAFENLNDDNIYKKKVKQYKFLLQPMSTDDLIQINYKNKVLSPKELEEAQVEYKDFCCFKFEILVDGFNGEITEYYDKNDDKVNYEQLLDYYLFQMQKDLKLTTPEGEEIPCSIFYFARNYEMTKSNRFMVGFKKPQGKVKQGKTFSFSYDNAYLNIGKINFQIAQKDFTS